MGSLILKRERGFTILEVVFAAAILGIGILGYTKIKASSRYSQVYSKQLSQAVLLSGSQMEDFLRRGYNHTMLSGLDGEAKTHLYGELGGVLSIGDFSFTDASWTVRQNTPSQLTKLIKFTGKWNSSREIELTQVQVQ
ncbi:MAG: prepilin-type N-terminal cleavage/methylation domain-containing protein [Desulfobulbales bacterium]|nr:prepilin-type N-terminal cleavage/methylation domain-containing protein [Desulfobulbales bacterium]